MTTFEGLVKSYFHQHLSAALGMALAQDSKGEKNSKPWQ